MKIEDPRSIPSSALRPTPSPTAAAKRADAGPAEAAGASQPAARVELSSRSREMHRALAAAEAAPDVRADKVAEAKQRIAQGTYAVNAETIARGMLDQRA